MGMYTQLNIGVDLRRDTPENIIDILNYMLTGGSSDVDEPQTTDHLLFSTLRWRFMLTCDSCYFDGHTDSSMVRDGIFNDYHLNIRSNLKNYDNEIELFLDFIRPYLDTDGFLGYKWYEEDDDPTLIYNNVYSEAIEYKEVN